jgi:hypothetical protein
MSKQSGLQKMCELQGLGPTDLDKQTRWVLV